MIKNLLALVALVVSMLGFAKVLLDCEVRDEAWRCDRLVRQGYPTGEHCKAAWAEVARLDGK